MNSVQVKCFLKLGENKSFTKTAEELYLSQSTVSKNIKSLEREIGVSLVIRNRASVKLSKEGEYFWNQLKLIDKDLQKAIKKIQPTKVTKQVKLNIGYTSLTFEKEFLAVFLKLIQNSNRSIHLKRISLSRDTNLAKELENKSIDFMIFQSDYFNNKTNFSFTPFFKGGFSVVMKKEDPLSEFEKIEISRLNGRKIYFWESKNVLTSVKKLKEKIYQQCPDSTLVETDQASLVEILVDSGSNEVGIVPSFVYNKYNDSVYFRFLDYPEMLEYGVGYLTEYKKSSYYKNIIHLLKKAAIETHNKW